jgi:recyclin-1
VQVGEYIAPLLTRAREISNVLYLTAVAASFRESWRIVDVLTTLSSNFSDKGKDKAEDVMYVIKFLVHSLFHIPHHRCILSKYR